MDHQPDYLQDLNNSDDRTHDFEVPLLSKTLRWHMPIIGEVPMSKYPIDFHWVLTGYLFFNQFIFLLPNFQLDASISGDKHFAVSMPIWTKISTFTNSFIPFLVYFIPECGEEYGKLKKLIE